MTSVVAISSSLRMEKGNTALILNPFLDGMREAGAQVDLVYSKKLNIQPCTGDFSCWGATPGKCHIQDDMEGLLNKLRDAEIWVYGVPVYVPMPGEMQNILNRMMPLFEESVSKNI
jgi:multimeric flavodoxin WrbA